MLLQFTYNNFIINISRSSQQIFGMKYNTNAVPNNCTVFQMSTQETLLVDGYNLQSKKKNIHFKDDHRYAISSSAEIVRMSFLEHIDLQMQDKKPNTIKSLGEILKIILDDMNHIDKPRPSNDKAFNIEARIAVNHKIVSNYMKPLFPHQYESSIIGFTRKVELGKIPEKADIDQYVKKLGEVGRKEWEDKYKKIIKKDDPISLYTKNITAGNSDFSIALGNFEKNVSKNIVDVYGNLVVDKFYTEDKNAINKIRDLDCGKIKLELPTIYTAKYRNLANNSMQNLNKTEISQYKAKAIDLYESLDELSKFKYPINELGFFSFGDFFDVKSCNEAFDGELKPLERIIERLRNGVKIRHLNLSNINVRYERSCCGCCGCCKTTEEEEEELRSLIYSFLEAILGSQITLDNLEKISFPTNLIANDDILKGIIEILNKAKSFNKLELPSFATKKVQYALCKFMRSEEGKLNVSENIFNNFLAAISNNTSLQEISFSNKLFYDFEYSSLHPRQIFLSSKVQRRCFGDDYGSRVLGSILNGIKRGMKLRNLNMAYNDLGNNSAQVLNEILVEGEHLSEVNIAGNAIIGNRFSRLVNTVAARKNIISFIQGGYVDGNKVPTIEHPTICGCIPSICQYDVNFMSNTQQSLTTLNQALYENIVNLYAMRVLINVYAQSEYMNFSINNLLLKITNIQQKEQKDALERQLQIRRAGASKIGINTNMMGIQVMDDEKNITGLLNLETIKEKQDAMDQLD